MILHIFLKIAAVVFVVLASSYGSGSVQFESTAQRAGERDRCSEEETISTGKGMKV